jgi:hypothetical protein
MSSGRTYVETFFDYFYSSDDEQVESDSINSKQLLSACIKSDDIKKYNELGEAYVSSKECKTAALMYAAVEEGEADIFAMLSKLPQEQAYVNEIGQSTYHIAARKNEVFIFDDAPVDSICSAIHVKDAKSMSAYDCACQDGSVDFLKKITSLKMKCSFDMAQVNNCFKMAIHSGNIEAPKIIFDRYTDLINQPGNIDLGKSEFGSGSDLHFAALYLPNKLGAVLAGGRSVFDVTSTGKNILHLLALSDEEFDDSVVDDENDDYCKLAKEKDSSGLLPANYFIRESKEGHLEKILTCYDKDEDQTILQSLLKDCATVGTGITACAQWVIEAGADPDYKYDEGVTADIFAAFANNSAVADFIKGSQGWWKFIATKAEGLADTVADSGAYIYDKITNPSETYHDITCYWSEFKHFDSFMNQLVWTVPYFFTVGAIKFYLPVPWSEPALKKTIIYTITKSISAIGIIGIIKPEFFAPFMEKILENKHNFCSDRNKMGAEDVYKVAEVKTYLDAKKFRYAQDDPHAYYIVTGNCRGCDKGHEFFDGGQDWSLCEKISCDPMGEISSGG